MEYACILIGYTLIFPRQVNHIVDYQLQTLGLILYLTAQQFP